ncbi:MAG: DUF433 domain-containing protein [Gemmataceae bacterium]|nr:DUF433 domain-containing protein [Gemmataceae bacterium]
MSTSQSNNPVNGATPWDGVVFEAEYGPKIKGTRITVYDVYYYLVKGRSPEKITEILPLSLEQVRAVGAYIDAHKEEVDAVHKQIEERIARGHPPEVQAKLDAIKAKYDVLWADRRRALGLDNGDERDSAGR